MNATKNLRISLENLGPIRKGQVEYKPLTILIGPNNTGKSYAATVLYALSQAVAGQLPRSLWRATNWGDVLYQAQFEQTTLRQLSADQRDLVNVGLENLKQDAKLQIDYALAEYLGQTEVRRLVNLWGKAKAFSIHFNPDGVNDDRLGIAIKSNAEQIDWQIPDLDDSRVPDPRGSAFAPPAGREYELRRASRLVWKELLDRSGFPRRNVHYLPSARSGMLAGLRLFAATAFEALRMGGGSTSLEEAKIPGLAGDFLHTMLAWPLTDDDRSDGLESQFRPALSVLEQEVLRGAIVVRRTLHGLPEIEFESGNLRLPIQYASSMIAELAPLAIWIKTVLSPGDWLIIDEPEAHLHPENQRLIAQSLVRLVRAGVRVVCPTHSSTILHQVSNHILAARLDPDEREAVGLSEHDFINPDEVAVYLFQPKRDGASIESVEVNPEWGISEDEFIRVGEVMGQQSYQLTVAGIDLELVHVGS